MLNEHGICTVLGQNGSGQNGTDKMVWTIIMLCGQNGIGQNGSGQTGTDKMVWTKCYTDKMLIDKMVRTNIGTDKWVRTKCGTSWND